jgi:hypothetical protein
MHFPTKERTHQKTRTHLLVHIYLLIHIHPKKKQEKIIFAS